MRTRNDVISGLSARRRGLTVADFMHQHYALAGADERLESMAASRLAWAVPVIVASATVHADHQVSLPVPALEDPQVFPPIDHAPSDHGGSDARRSS